MKLNAKCQVVIPGKLRRRWGFKPGMEVEFVEKDGYLAVVKADQAWGAVLEKWGGRYKHAWGNSVDEFIRAARGR